jgi:GNAT superfamily N-acetyltransferase
MTVEIDTFGTDDLPAVQDAIVRVYAAAFGEPPYLEGPEGVAHFAETLPRHAARAGFRCCVARAEGGPALLGFGYGYTSAPGQWWYDAVAPALPPDERAYWLANTFEVVELAVLPAMQGQGIGGRLLDALLTGLPQRTAVLSTKPGAPAYGFYRRRGWVPLLEKYVFPGGAIPIAILGRDL